MHGCGGLPGLGVAQQSASARLDDGNAAAARPADIHVVVRLQTGSREVPSGAKAQESLCRQCFGHGFGFPCPNLVLCNWHFGCGTEQLRTNHIGIRRIDHHPLDRFAQQGFRMMDKVGVQRVVAGDQHHQRPLTSSAATARLLPERGDRPGESGQQHGIQSSDVDSQFQRVGGGQAAQLAVGQGSLEYATVLGEIAGAVGSNGPPEVGRDCVQPRLGGQGSQFSATA